jgi:hypothetical protein
MSLIDRQKKRTKLPKTCIPFLIVHAHTCLLVNVATLTLCLHGKNILHWTFFDVTNA